MALIENIQGFLLQAKINGDPQNLNQKAMCLFRHYLNRYNINKKYLISMNFIIFYEQIRILLGLTESINLRPGAVKMSGNREGLDKRRIDFMFNDY